MKYGGVVVLSLLLGTILINTPLLSNEKSHTSGASNAKSDRENLAARLRQKDYHGIYRGIKNSGNQASDEEIVQYILENDGYKNWGKLTSPDQDYAVLKITGKSSELTGISQSSLLGQKESELTQRIINFYRNASKMDLGSANSMWLQQFSELKLPVHKTLLEGNEERVADLLIHPAQSPLFHGFENLCSTLDQQEMIDIADQFALQSYMLLKELAAVVGVTDPSGQSFQNHLPCTPANVEKVLLALDKRFGFKIDFPNPYPGEIGLITSRGIASYRAIQSLYQAWKCAQLVDNPRTSRVLEIGGGLGRAAYYARKLGFTNYTIVDLPMTSVAQAHFLANTLGKDSIDLYGENRKNGIHLLPPEALFAKSTPYDLVVNFDGFTEMAPETARRYWKYIENNTPLFLSVNHEINPFTVQDLYKPSNCKLITRVPYSLREGYLEEIIKFPGSSQNKLK